MVKLIFIAGIVGVVMGLLISYGYWIPRMSDTAGTPTASNPLETVSDENIFPRAKSRNISGTHELIEFPELKLSFELPNNWVLKAAKLNRGSDGKLYHSSISLNNWDQSINMIPDFQGGFCDGPDAPRSIENVSLKNGIPGKRYDCGGDHLFYIYEVSKVPFRNLFISTTRNLDEQGQEILSSIKY